MGSDIAMGSPPGCVEPPSVDPVLAMGGCFKLDEGLTLFERRLVFEDGDDVVRVRLDGVVAVDVVVAARLGRRDTPRGG